jgi:ABC-type sugar transport system ATPase subunit
VTNRDLVKHMVGRDVSEERIRKAVAPRKEQRRLLSLKGVSRKNVLNDINFELRAGEILGIFGLVGAGRTEVARAIVGADPIDAGEIVFGERRLRLRSPKEAIRQGVCLAPEDRKRQGLLLDKSVRENVALPSLGSLTRIGVLLNQFAITRRAREAVKALSIATSSVEARVRNLSGGNQQKVVIAKWLGTNMQVFIFDEPTRGVDVGAKEEIRKLIVELASQDKAVILISSEIPEILAVSDRILVMHEGSVAADIPIGEASQEKLLAFSMGSKV